jgi:hypothetical protein
MKRPPLRAGEKESLLVFLDKQRDVMLWKLEGSATRTSAGR